MYFHLGVTKEGADRWTSPRHR